MEGLERLISPSRFREEPVDLLVLSACETALGDERAALGLAGVALKAGARSGIGTLWAVNDHSASQVITEFYHQLKSGLPKAKALQAAQEQFIGHDKYSHPNHWAPFLLIGSWH